VATSLAVGSSCMAVAGADGAVVTLKLRNLTLDATLPKPLFSVCGAPCQPSANANQAPTAVCASESCSYLSDAVAVAMTPSQKHIVVVYADHNIRCWQLRDRGAVSLSWELPTHTKCIWALTSHCSPAGNQRLATASEDGTVRIWTLHSSQAQRSVQPMGVIELAPRPPSMTSRRPCQEDLPVGRRSAWNAQTIVPRAIAWTPCGGCVAIGDHTGMVHVFDTETFRCIKAWPAHESLVRCLAFSEQPVAGRMLLATAGDEGLVHICDASKQEYTILQTLNEHDGMGVTAVTFTGASEIVSCAQDCQMVFRYAWTHVQNAVVA
jgi:WD40 repeat protein